jgi:hypothetical protein
MPQRASLFGYCAMVRTPLRLPTTDVAVPPIFEPRQPPLVSWRFSSALRKFQSPSAQITVCSKRPQYVMRSLHHHRSQIPVSFFADALLWLALPGVPPLTSDNSSLRRERSPLSKKADRVRWTSPRATSPAIGESFARKTARKTNSAWRKASGSLAATKPTPETDFGSIAESDRAHTTLLLPEEY